MAPIRECGGVMKAVFKSTSWCHVLMRRNTFWIYCFLVISVKMDRVDTKVYLFDLKYKFIQKLKCSHYLLTHPSRWEVGFCCDAPDMFPPDQHDSEWLIFILGCSYPLTCNLSSEADHSVLSFKHCSFLMKTPQVHKY